MNFVGLGTLLVAGICLGCGSAEVENRRTDFQGKLRFGARINYGPHQSNHGFSLAEDPRVVATKMSGDEISQISFNPAMMEVVENEDEKEVLQALINEMAVPLNLQTDQWLPIGFKFLRDDLKVYAWERYIDGIPVHTSFIKVMLQRGDGGWRIRQLSCRGFVQAAFSGESASAPALDAVVPYRTSDIFVHNIRPMWYPALDRGELFLAAATEYRFRHLEEAVDYTVIVDHDSGSVLEAVKRQYGASYTVQGESLKRTYLDGQTTFQDLPFTKVSVDGVDRTTDGHGRLELAAPPGNAAIVLESSRFRIRDASTGEQSMVIPTVVEGRSVRTEVNSEDQIVAINAYQAVHRVSQFARRHLSASDVPQLNAAMGVTINVNDSCNAFYDGNISLFRSGNNCANTALINDVIFHEWGHALDDFTGMRSGITDGAFSEGIGDILAAYMTGDSVMAPGFIVNDRGGIRQLMNNKRFPDDRGAVHDEGQIIGGAFWDLRQGLIRRYGPERGGALAEELFLRHLLVTDAYVDSYEAVLVLDDDDANPGTKSPNHCLITAAFAAHGLADPEPNCEDAPIDNSMFHGEIAVKTTAMDLSGNATLVVATGSESFGAYLCQGDMLPCLVGSTPVATDFNSIGALPSGKLAFLAETPVASRVQEEFTIVITDAFGDPIGAKSFKWTEK